jgi:DNA-directed RNA polymerase subunit RPC12/RpoP
MGRPNGIKKSKGLGDELDNLIRKEVQNVVLDELSDQSDIPDNLPGESIVNPQEEPDAEMEKILAAFPSDKGYYGKLYRKSLSGQLEFKYVIDHLEDIEDPELYIYQLIKENRWKGGEYVLRIIKRNSPGAIKTIRWSIADDSITGDSSNGSPASNNNNNNNNNIGSAPIGMDLQSALNLVKTVKEISNDNPAQLQKTISETFNAGMEVMKPMVNQNTSTPMNFNNILQMALPIITMLKELGIIAPPKTDGTTEMLKVLKELGVIKTEPTNPQQGLMDNVKLMESMGLLKKNEDATLLKQLATFKELGLVKLPSDENGRDGLIKQITELKKVMAMINPNGEGGDGTPKSTINQIIDILGPRVPDIIKDVTLSTNKFLDLKKAQMSQQQMSPVSYVSPSPQGPTQVPYTPQSGPTMNHPAAPPFSNNYLSEIEVPDVQQSQQQTTVEHPSNNLPAPTNESIGDRKVTLFIDDLKDHILSGQDEFESIYNGIIYAFGVQFIQQYQTGLIPVETITQMLQSRDMFFAEPAATGYINRFFGWVDTLIKPKSYICQACNATIDLTALEYQEDNQCTECGGQLMLASEFDASGMTLNNDSGDNDDSVLAPTNGQTSYAIKDGNITLPQ